MSENASKYTININYDPMDVILDIPFNEDMNISPISNTTEMSFDASYSLNMDILKSILDLISEYGIYDVVNVMWPITTLVDTNTLYMPKKEKIERYIKSFSILFTHYLPILNDIFKFKYMIRNNSVNGQTFVFEINPSNWFYPKLLIKVPRNTFPYADSVSYEYYVGKTLNQLRYDNIEHFALVYGRF